MLVLTMFAVAGLALLLLVFALASIVLVVRTLFWLVLLPLRLLFSLLLLPFTVIKGLVGGLLFLITGPLFAATVIVLAVAGSVLFSLPLAPILLLLFVAWLFSRTIRRPTLAR